MKAAILTDINTPLLVSDHVELTPLKVGQVLVKVLTSGLCGAQVHEMHGYKGNAKYTPHLMGHEGCGIVEDIGQGVTNVKIGNKVVMHWRKGNGIESENPQYIFNNKTITSGKVTTLSEYSIVSENRLTVIPNNIPADFGALLGCSFTTAFGIIDNELDLKFGESVAVVGCGGVGLSLIQALSLKSAAPIIAMDAVDKKTKTMEMGADHFINIKTDDIENIIKSIVLNRGIDIIIDTTGNASVFNNMIKYLSANGRLILVGQPPPDVNFEISNMLNLFNGNGIIIKTTQGGKTNPTVDIPKYINLYNNNKLNIDGIISHSFSLDKINDAFDLLKTGNCNRIMIKICEDNVV